MLFVQQNLADTVKRCKNCNIEAHYGKIPATTSNQMSARPLPAEQRQEVAQECSVIYQPWVDLILLNWQWIGPILNESIQACTGGGSYLRWTEAGGDDGVWNGRFTRGVEDRLCTTKTTGLSAALIACTASSWLAFCKSTPQTYLSQRTEKKREDRGEGDQRGFKGDCF